MAPGLVQNAHDTSRDIYIDQHASYGRSHRSSGVRMDRAQQELDILEIASPENHARTNVLGLSICEERSHVERVFAVDQ